jgi:SAM-dependent methyltransferase
MIDSRVLIRSLLGHSQIRGVSVDSPEFREVSRKIIREKPCLRKIYDEWYGMFADGVPKGEGIILEIGSGSGFCSEIIPGVVTSDISIIQGIDLVFDACDRFPFADSTLKSILMINTFHHLPSPENFLHEAYRCLKTGGKLLMIEEWMTPWSRFVYTKLHHEPFEPDVKEWEYPSTGPLSSANGAMPWIIFKRDRKLFEDRFPHLIVEKIQPIMPIRYLLSGGVSMRTLVPEYSFWFWKMVERVCDFMAMFAMIRLVKSE